jgi:adenosine/AMP kinase
MELKKVPVDNPEQLNFILGQSHFIKTVEDLYEAIVGTVPGAKFGLAFCEASDVCLVRHAGTDDELIALAQKNALSIGAGHSFIIFLRDMFPVNILNAIKNRTGSVPYFLRHGQSGGGHCR